MPNIQPFLDYRGIKLYRFTKDGRELTFWYSLQAGRDEADPPSVDDSTLDFDVRDLARALGMELTDDNHAEVLRAAIDQSLIKPKRVFYL